MSALRSNASSSHFDPERTLVAGSIGGSFNAMLYRSGRSRNWVKSKNPMAPAVNREAEEDWAR
jgi:hypothetical protein